MIKAEEFCNALQEAGISFVAGVPDSLLAEFCACVADVFQPAQHVITANEGNAVGMAIGHYLSTGNPALVYMQNSGLGNAVNPITSLASQEVYSIPMVLLIGWRGEIDENGMQLKDEPQHVKQGRVTLQLLELLGIPVHIIDKDSEISTVIKEVNAQARELQAPVAMLARKESFAAFNNTVTGPGEEYMTREEVLGIVIESLDPSIPLISTTGKLSRELFELRKIDGIEQQRDFLTVGGMGHASSIASAIANSTNGKVACLDGDGAFLMHMGSLTNTSQYNNLVHIVFNNGAHESVGGQPTKALNLSLADIALQCGYGRAVEVGTADELSKCLSGIDDLDQSVLIEIHCRNESRDNLGRPDQSPIANKNDFMEFLKK